LLLDDGRLRLVVERCGDDFAQTCVVVGGRLSERKGVNMPGVLLPLTSLSFVQRPQDVADVPQMTAMACAVARREQFAQAGQTIVAIAGMPFGEAGTTHLMRIATV
jgi:pyruvate kinase